MSAKVIISGLRLLRRLRPDVSPGAAVLAVPTIPNKMKNLSKKFSSLNELSAWISNNPVSGYFVDYAKKYKLASTDTGKNNENFTGTKNFQVADDLMLHGWADGAKRVQAAMIQAAGAASDRPRCYNSVVGFAPNVPNYLTGCPLNMINKKRVRVPARVVDIVYNNGVACNIDAKDIEMAAAKLFNVVVGLERSGIRVNLWVLNINISNDQNASVAVKIKSANQPFNLLKMVYPCVHPSFQRRHMFAALERLGVTGSNSDWGGYGRVIKDSEKIKQVVNAFGLSDKNIFDYYAISGKSEKQIADMIK